MSRDEAIGISPATATEILSVARNASVSGGPDLTLESPSPGDRIEGSLILSGRCPAPMTAIIGETVVGRSVRTDTDRFVIKIPTPPSGLTMIRLSAETDGQASVPLAFVYCRGHAGPDEPPPRPAVDTPLVAAVTRLLDKWSLPGAVILDERADGEKFVVPYGYADVTANRPMVSNSRFRIGSLGKLVTAATIHGLVDDGLLDPDQPVADLLDLPPGPLDGVTPLHLLYNRSGVSFAVDLPRHLPPPGFDPVTKAEETASPPPLPPEHIAAVLANATKNAEPGEAFRYMTGNYWLLGRVVEACTGTGYANFARTTVLAPIGLGHLSLGASFPDIRVSGEVTYHGGDPGLVPAASALGLEGDVPAAYATSIPLRDATGGWVMSAEELATFAWHLQDRSPNILSPRGLAAFLGRPPFPHARTDWYYAQGTLVAAASGIDDLDAVTWWHFGGVDGAYGIACRFPGRVVVVLINGTPLNTEVFLAMLWSTIAKVIGGRGRP